MKNKKELYEDALAIARENIPPAKNHLDISLGKGKMLAEEYNADIDLVLIGILLMDIKLSEAMRQGKGHGKVPYESIEAEVCANADCYRFIHPLGVFTFIGVLAKRDLPFEDQIKGLKAKLDEKYNILSLPKAKEELCEYYDIYSKQFNELLK